MRLSPPHLGSRNSESSALYAIVNEIIPLKREFLGFDRNPEHRGRDIAGAQRGGFVGGPAWSYNRTTQASG